MKYLKSRNIPCGGFTIINNVKIMVVDDDSLIRDLTVTALTYCVNRKVKSFDNCKLAWQYIQGGGDVDIVISDVDMPEMNGFDLMSKVKEKYPEKAFIIMSGESDYEQKSHTEGASAFLAKPFEMNDLFNIVQCFVVDTP
ncbi:MAG: response regulator [Desulfobacteraceae bacterium]|nr:response regulator [Desulfobacteraceae bacterium]